MDIPGDYFDGNIITYKFKIYNIIIRKWCRSVTLIGVSPKSYLADETLRRSRILFQRLLDPARPQGETPRSNDRPRR